MGIQNSNGRRLEGGLVEKWSRACLSNVDCDTENPVCSEFGLCECTCYRPGDPQCWGAGDSVCGKRNKKPELGIRAKRYAAAHKKGRGRNSRPKGPRLGRT